MAPGRGALTLHPSRVVRFLGNPLPDPWLGATCWSDSVLQVLYDAVHAVALTTAGATTLMHEAKVDVVTLPNLSEHLSSADTTAQLSARFAYAAAMTSINDRCERPELPLLSEAARRAFDFDPAPPKTAKGDVVPDGVKARLALEVKYVDDFQTSPRNPDYTPPFPNKISEEDIAQAAKYEKEFDDGVLWVTNSPELAKIYVSTFMAHGLTRSRVVVVPSRRE